MAGEFDLDPAVLGRILEAIPEFVIVIDRDGVIRYINRVEPGYDRDAVIGMEARAIIAPESFDVFQSSLESAIETGAEQQYDVMMHSPSG
jgi:PAS domain S-box-containing protein